MAVTPMPVTPPKKFGVSDEEVRDLALRLGARPEDLAGRNLSVAPKFTAGAGFMPVELPKKFGVSEEEVRAVARRMSLDPEEFDKRMAAKDAEAAQLLEQQNSQSNIEGSQPDPSLSKGP
jgi:hypothetical protein